MADLTPQSLKLFLALCDDAPNWSGTPILLLSRAEKGNLTQLKQEGLLTTFVDRGDTFAYFTDAGRELAAEHGHADLGD